MNDDIKDVNNEFMIRDSGDYILMILIMDGDYDS